MTCGKPYNERGQPTPTRSWERNRHQTSVVIRSGNSAKTRNGNSKFINSCANKHLQN